MWERRRRGGVRAAALLLAAVLAATLAPAAAQDRVFLPDSNCNDLTPGARPGVAVFWDFTETPRLGVGTTIPSFTVSMNRVDAEGAISDACTGNCAGCTVNIVPSCPTCIRVIGEDAAKASFSFASFDELAGQTFAGLIMPETDSFDGGETPSIDFDATVSGVAIVDADAGTIPMGDGESRTVVHTGKPASLSFVDTSLIGETHEVLTVVVDVLDEAGVAVGGGFEFDALLTAERASEDTSALWTPAEARSLSNADLVIDAGGSQLTFEAAPTEPGTFDLKVTASGTDVDGELGPVETATAVVEERPVSSTLDDGVTLSWTAGAGGDSFQVFVLDSAGNRMLEARPGMTVNATVIFGATAEVPEPEDVLIGSLAYTDADAGVTFTTSTDVTLVSDGTVVRLTFADSTSEGSGSDDVPLTVLPGAASVVTIENAPTVNCGGGDAAHPDCDAPYGGAKMEGGLATVAQLRDSFGNGVPEAGVEVTVSLLDATEDPAVAGAFDGGTLAATTGSAGAVEFEDLVINTQGTYSVIVASDGLTGAASAEFDVTAGARVAIEFVQGPQSSATSLRSPATFSGATEVQLRAVDLGGNLSPYAAFAGEIRLLQADGVTAEDPALLSGTAAVEGEGVAALLSFPGLGVDAAGVYTLGAESDTFTAVSGTFEVVAGDPEQLVFLADPSQCPDGVTCAGLTAGEVWQDELQPVVVVADAAGNPLSELDDVEFTVTLDAAVGDGDVATLTGGATTVAVDPATALATFSGLAVRESGTVFLTAAVTSDGLDAASAFFTVSGGLPATIEIDDLDEVLSGFVAGNFFGDNDGGAGDLSLEVKILDSGGNRAVANVTGATMSLQLLLGEAREVALTLLDEVDIDFELDGTSDVLATPVYSSSDAIMTAAGDYVAVLSLTLPAEGGLTLTAPDFDFSVAAADPSALSFAEAQPASGAANLLLTAQPTVTLTDAFGNRALPSVLEGVSDLTVRLGVADGSAGALSGTGEGVLDSTGLVSFADLSVTAAGSYVLTAVLAATEDGPVTIGGDSDSFEAAAAARLDFLAEPASSAARLPMDAQPSVALVDGDGARVDASRLGDGTHQVTVAGADDLFGVEGEVMTVDMAADGSCTFEGLSVRFASTGVTLVVSAPVPGSGGAAAVEGVSAAFDVGDAPSFRFTTQPADTSELLEFADAPSVELVDSAGDAVTVERLGGGTFTVRVALREPSDDGDGASELPVSVLAGTAEVELAADGTAEFAGLSVLAEAPEYQMAVALAFEDTSFEGVSDSFAVGPVPELRFVTQPVATSALLALSTAPAVAAFDVSGTQLTLERLGGGTLTVTLGVSSMEATDLFLGGSTTATVAADGTATFEGLSVSEAASDAELGASMPWLDGEATLSGASDVFVVGGAPELRFVTQPAAAAAKAELDPAPAVAAFDSAGTQVTLERLGGGTVTVSLSLFSFASEGDPDGGGAADAVLDGSASAEVAADGSATFAGLSVTAEQAGLGLQADMELGGETLTGVSDSFDVAGPEVVDAVIELPAASDGEAVEVEAGVSVIDAGAAPAVTVLDVDGVAYSSASAPGTVTLSVVRVGSAPEQPEQDEGLGPGGLGIPVQTVELQGDTSMTPDAATGVANFSALDGDLTLNAAGTYRWVVTTGSVSVESDATFTVAAGPVACLVFLRDPGAEAAKRRGAPRVLATNGTSSGGSEGEAATTSPLPQQPAVAAVDANYNLVSDAALTVHLYAVNAADTPPDECFVCPAEESSGFSLASGCAHGTYEPDAASVDAETGVQLARASLSGTTSLATDGGVASFEDVAVAATGDGLLVAAYAVLTADADEETVAAGKSEEPFDAEVTVVSSLPDSTATAVTVANVVGPTAAVVGGAAVATSATSIGTVQAASGASTFRGSTMASVGQHTMVAYIVFLQLFIAPLEHNSELQDVFAQYESQRIFNGNTNDDSSKPIFDYSNNLFGKSLTVFVLALAALFLTGAHMDTCCANFTLYPSFWVPLFLLLLNPLCESLLLAVDNFATTLALASITLIMCGIIYVVARVRPEFEEHRHLAVLFLPAGRGSKAVLYRPEKPKDDDEGGSDGDSDGDDDDDEESGDSEDERLNSAEGGLTGSAAEARKEKNKRRRKRKKDKKKKEKKKEKDADSKSESGGTTFLDKARARIKKLTCQCRVYMPKENRGRTLQRQKSSRIRREALDMVRMGLERNPEFDRRRRAWDRWKAFRWRTMFEEVTLYQPAPSATAAGHRRAERMASTGNVTDAADAAPTPAGSGAVGVVRRETGHFMQFVKLFYQVLLLTLAISLDGTGQLWGILALITVYVAGVALTSSMRNPFLQQELLFSTVLGLQFVLLLIFIDDREREWTIFTIIAMQVLAVPLFLVLIKVFPEDPPEEVPEFIPGDEPAAGAAGGDVLMRLNMGGASTSDFARLTDETFDGAEFAQHFDGLGQGKYHYASVFSSRWGDLKGLKIAQLLAAAREYWDDGSERHRREERYAFAHYAAATKKIMTRKKGTEEHGADLAEAMGRMGVSEHLRHGLDLELPGGVVLRSPPESAMQFLRASAKMSPGREEAGSLLAEHFVACGQMASARDVYERAGEAAWVEPHRAKFCKRAVVDAARRARRAADADADGSDGGGGRVTATTSAAASAAMLATSVSMPGRRADRRRERLREGRAGAGAGTGTTGSSEDGSTSQQKPLSRRERRRQARAKRKAQRARADDLELEERLASASRTAARQGAAPSVSSSSESDVGEGQQPRQQLRSKSRVNLDALAAGDDVLLDEAEVEKMTTADF